jgi:hypothetical protein
VSARRSRARAASDGQAGPPRRRGPARADDDALRRYQRAESTELLTCARDDCHAVYLNDRPGKAAHKIVFGHSPKAPARNRAGREPPPRRDRLAR